LLAPLAWNPCRNKHGTRYQQYAYIHYREPCQLLSRLCNILYFYRRAG
jgi:hypothetical protein